MTWVKRRWRRSSSESAAKPRRRASSRSGVRRKSSKNWAFVDVPVAVEPRAAQLVGQGLEAAEVVGVGGHERGVVGHERADEAVILGALGAEILPVDEQALDPAVADAAGVHRAVDAFRIIIHSAYAGAQGVHLRLGVLGGLVDEEHVDLGALKSGGVLVAVAVAEEDAAPLGKTMCFLASL